MNKKTIQSKPIRSIGIGLQIITGIYLALLVVVLVVIPIPDDLGHGELAQKYKEVVSSIDPYDGLIWVGMFCLGRWMQKTWR